MNDPGRFFTSRLNLFFGFFSQAAFSSFRQILPELFCELSSTLLGRSQTAIEIADWDLEAKELATCLEVGSHNLHSDACFYAEANLQVASDPSI